MPTHPLKVLLIDHFDSFTGNIYDALLKQGAVVEVKRTNYNLNDYDRVVIGPGPGNPDDVPDLLKIIPDTSTPLLGICLGHQILAKAYGGAFKRADLPCHGKKTVITHRFHSFPPLLKVGRYHSLVVDLLPPCLEVTALGEGYIMGIRHKTLKQNGLQFHPDSFMTDFGDEFFKEFLTYGEIRCSNS